MLQHPSDNTWPHPVRLELHLLKQLDCKAQQHGVDCPAVVMICPVCVQVRFINAAAPHIGTEAAYMHGAHLVLLDGIGLGVGMPLQVRPSIPQANVTALFLLD